MLAGNVLKNVDTCCYQLFMHYNILPVGSAQAVWITSVVSWKSHPLKLMVWRLSTISSPPNPRAEIKYSMYAMT
jgi:hypothetical protein